MILMYKKKVLLLIFRFIDVFFYLTSKISLFSNSFSKTFVIFPKILPFFNQLKSHAPLISLFGQNDFFSFSPQQLE